MGCLYKLTSPSGKSYIGITSKTFDERLKVHLAESRKKKSRSPLYAAFRKYGLDTFSNEILVDGIDDWQQLCDLEKRAIVEHATLSPSGYNMTTGGDGVIGLTEEAKQRHRTNTSTGTLKAWANGTQRAKMLATISTEEFKAKHAKATSIGTLKAYENEDVRKHHLEKVSSVAFREHASEQVKALWQNPEYRANQRQKRYAQPPRSDESKRAQGEKMRLLIAKRKQEGTYWLRKKTNLETACP